MRKASEGTAPAAPPRLALRFAVYTGVGLVLASACILVFVSYFSTRQAERAATVQARYMAEAAMSTGLSPTDFSRPVRPARREKLDRIFEEEILGGGVTGAKLVGPAGVVTYSSNPELIGARVDDAARVQEAFEGRLLADRGDAAESGFPGESPETLRALVPLRFPTGDRGVVAVYLDYAPIERAAHEAFLPIAGVLEVVLIVLYLALVPFLRRASVRMREQMREIEHRALHDDLTGLPNRVLFQSRIEEVVHESKLRSTSAAVLLIDLDRFKEINDTLGHHTGDLMLKELGGRLAGLVEEGTMLARLGGDEFGVVALGNREDALRLAGRIRKALDEPFLIRGLALTVEGSVGIALSPRDGDDVDTLIQCADVAMYVAKSSRTGVSVYSRDEDPNDAEQLKLVAELRRAVERRELVVHFQPKVELGTDEIVGVEALVRWQHPELGLVLPDEFIPLAERTGLIKQLSLLVLDAALEQCHAWGRAGIDIQVAVNLAVPSLLDPELPDQIAGLLSARQVEPSRLEIEITESSIMADPLRVREVLEQLRTTGVQVAVDDFGTGYSSLAYLKRLPVDSIKIDKSFVINMLENRNDALIVRSTIELARSLGLGVVAEGVESERIWHALEALGCHVAQGYYVGRPLDGRALQERLLAIASLRREAALGGLAAA